MIFEYGIICCVNEIYGMEFNVKGIRNNNEIDCEFVVFW